MRLRTIVPTLGLVLAAPAAINAADVGGITIGGFVDTWLQITSADEASPFVDTDGDGESDVLNNDGEADDLIIDFAAETELQFGYQIGDAVSAQVDIEFYGGGADPYLETAIVKWQLTPEVSLMAGEFVDWLGWEAADAPGRYRFDRSPLVSEGNFYGQKSVTGVGVSFAATETVGVSVFIVDSIYGETGKEAADLALGGDVSIDIEGYGNVNLEFGYDINAAPSMGGTVEESILALGANTTYTGTEKLTVGAEVHYMDYDSAAAYGVMVLGNYQFDEMASGTLSFAYLEPNDDADDDEVMEIAAAILTTPTGDANFALNFEVQYRSRGDLGRDGDGTAGSPSGDRNDLSIFVEMLAIIP